MDATLDVDGRAHDVRLAKGKSGWSVEVDGDAFEARLDRNGSGVLVRIGDRTLHVSLGRPGEAVVDGKPIAYRVQTVSGSAVPGKAGPAHATHVRPPMNGKLERILVKPGQEIAKGDVLFVLEAMKMHNEVKAPVAGKVAAIHLQAGATVEPRQIVLDLEPL
ncbi:MAG: biotin/lipoyl-containing protein [Candidatus Thermoplasmatota archaeon]